MGTKNQSPGSQFTPRGVTQGVTLVSHEHGRPIDAVIDNDGVLRLAVDANVTIENATINVDLDHTEDSVAIGDGTDLLSINPDGSLNIRLFDESGVAFSAVNPMPVEIITTGGEVPVEIDAADGDNIAISAHPNQISADNLVSVTTSGSYVNILSYTAPFNDIFIVFGELMGGIEATVRIRLNGSTIRMKQLNQSNPNLEFSFIEPRKLNSGDTLTIEAKVNKNIPASMAAGIDFFASLQGYRDI